MEICRMLFTVEIGLQANIFFNKYNLDTLNAAL
jgi:hypothetical protein